MKVLALASYPIQAASTRYRVAQFVGPLAERGIELTIRPFLDAKLFESLYQRRVIPRTSFGLLKSAVLRFRDLLAARGADVVFVQREAMIFGPPLFEWLITRAHKIPMVLDLDDATYLPYISPTYGRVTRALKWFSKTDDLIRWANIVTCGNRVIADYVMSRGKTAVIIPTVVDTDRFRPRTASHKTDIPVIGWVGTHSTYQYLATVFPAIERLAREHRFRLKIVGAGRERITIPGVEVENLSWSLEREIDDFQSFDIGLYPIVEDEWSVAKSGFKSVQYMATGIPFVTTPVGACAEIGEVDVTHFTAQTEEEWYVALGRLLVDENLRLRMGAAGRSHAVQHYSVAVQADKLSEAFRAAVSK
jgi:glycosyltransferase involved in cell wall biosynthesis